MRFWIITTACMYGALIAGCAPALNWREIQVPDTSLMAAFPCKPQKGTRDVSMVGTQVTLTMHSCDSDGATFAVGHARLVDPALVGPALQQWRAATEQGVQVRNTSAQAFTPERASALPQSVRLRVAGTRADGSPVELQAAWFARGTEVFVAMVYAPALSPQAVEPFMAGLRLR